MSALGGAFVGVIAFAIASVVEGGESEVFETFRWAILALFVGTGAALGGLL